MTKLQNSRYFQILLFYIVLGEFCGTSAFWGQPCDGFQIRAKVLGPVTFTNVGESIRKSMKLWCVYILMDNIQFIPNKTQNMLLPNFQTSYNVLIELMNLHMQIVFLQRDNHTTGRIVSPHFLHIKRMLYLMISRTHLLYKVVS